MASRFDFSNISWKWVFISIIIFFIAQLIISVIFGILGVVTLGVGFLLFLILKPLTYFIGGYITGKLSSGITLSEPAIGAVIVVILGTIFDASRAGFGEVFWAILSGILAYVFALLGAQFGEGRRRFA